MSYIEQLRALVGVPAQAPAAPSKESTESAWLPSGMPALLPPLVMRFEGLHRVGKDGLVHPYMCPAGYPTQGWGLRVASMDVPQITRAEANARLVAVLPDYVARTLRVCPNLKDDAPRLTAAADFVFNCGPVAFSTSTFGRRMREQDWERAAIEVRRWVFGGGRRLPGLVARREAEAQLIYSDSNSAR